MKHYCKSVPFLLIGCKTDLRFDQELITRLQAKNIDLVTEYEVSIFASVPTKFNFALHFAHLRSLNNSLVRQGMELAKKVKANGYMDCSAKQNTNVKDVFERAARLALASGGGGGCCVLL